jgi:AraC-like DNA-binding protein
VLSTGSQVQLSTEAACGVRHATPRLEAYRLFRSRDPDLVQGFLESENFRPSFSRRDSTPVDVHINGVYIRQVAVGQFSAFLGHFTYGRAVVLEVQPAHDDYWFQFPSHGRFMVDVDDQSVCCDETTGAVLSTGHRNVITTAAGCGRVALAVGSPTMSEALSAMLGAPLSRPLEFRPAMQLASGYGRSLVGHVRAGIEDFEQSDSLLRHPVTLQAFEQFLVLGLLLHHEHNYSEALARPVPAVASRDVKRAIDFIEGNIEAPIAIADIVAASAVSGRALFKHFRRFTGFSPMQYVRETRLRRVRDALLSAQPDEQIAAIAARWGFSHPGRFASDYRRRFGEAPLETKRRARAGF